MRKDCYGNVKKCCFFYWWAPAARTFPLFFGGARLRRARFPFLGGRGRGAGPLFFPFPFIFFWGAPSACMFLVALFFPQRRACGVHIERLSLHFLVGVRCWGIWDLVGSGSDWLKKSHYPESECVYTNLAPEKSHYSLFHIKSFLFFCYLRIDSIIKKKEKNRLVFSRESFFCSARNRLNKID